jgi:hypothetical protein
VTVRGRGGQGRTVVDRKVRNESGVVSAPRLDRTQLAMRGR